MRDQQGGEIAEGRAGGDADQGLLEQVEQGSREREFAAPGRHCKHAEGDDRAHGIVESGLAHHCLRDAVADMDLAEHRHQCRRIGRGQRGAEQQRDDQRDAENIVRGNAGDDGGDDDADRGDHDDGDPDLLEHGKAQRGAAVEQDIARAEQQDDLVQRRGGLDVDQARAHAGRSPCRQSGTRRHRGCGFSAPATP